ncbi:paladin-like [Acanthaster planci]|uniref:Paladin-like n=1 Tax=Acanthaster planci TaxID=133434 RepID=A0A8B7Z701_ACAPL|nr:paladin-like [Acanthaster planci]XP_022101423.1 paladin-like [Acanthaster planci]XP_022101424.1 paladin-like [Acanthaster planci]
MGTGASSASSRSPSPEMPRNNRLEESDRRKNSFGIEGGDKWKGHNVICNEVAPIIITKDCFEEFQCTLLAEKQEVTKGSIKDGLPEHTLVQGKYFMVADQFKGIDKMKTTEKQGAPNFRRAGGGFAVFGMGQPTALGLAKVMDTLGQEGCSELIVVCIREEPVLFLKRNEDFVSYTPREREKLCENIYTRIATSLGISNNEVALRKEILRYALRDQESEFYFYEDIDQFVDEPHKYCIYYEEHLKTIQEMYAIHTVSQTNARYLRMPMRTNGAPDEQVIDTFFDVLKDVPTLFDHQDTSTPGMVFVGHMGGSRTTFAMVLGMLVLAHKHGFPDVAYEQTHAMEEKTRNLEKGEFPVVQQLCGALPDGIQTKQEVDVLIDLCDDMSNIRGDIYDSKKKMEAIKQDYEIAGGSAKQFFLQRMFKYLERYCFLLLFNSYLHQQKIQMFCQSFQVWMQQHPILYRILGDMDSFEKDVNPAQQIAMGNRFLVADEYLGLDVLSSHREVKVSNFRRVPGLPVFGMAQPGREGLAKVIQHLVRQKYTHSSVHVFTLRGEVVLECDGATYTPRKVKSLSRNVFIPGITVNELEERELKLKNQLLKLNGPVEIYQDITEPRQAEQFSTILTLREMFENQQQITPELHYHRVAAMEYERSPPEKEFDFLVNVIKDLKDIYTDEDGPALVFNCDCGKERTTVFMAAAGLIIWHQKGFPVGVKLEEQERISVPQAEYTKGEFAVVMNLVRRLPLGSQVKREVDLMLDKCSETMTPMHYHQRETIFSTYNKVKSAKDEETAARLRHQSFNFLERYIYLILFNSYLHIERPNNWTSKFSTWMIETGRKIGAYETLDNLHYHDLDGDDAQIVSSIRHRWVNKGNKHGYQGTVE